MTGLCLRDQVLWSDLNKMGDSYNRTVINQFNGLRPSLEFSNQVSGHPYWILMTYLALITFHFYQLEILILQMEYMELDHILIMACLLSWPLIMSWDSRYGMDVINCKKNYMILIISKHISPLIFIHMLQICKDKDAQPQIWEYVKPLKGLVRFLKCWL